MLLKCICSHNTKSSGPTSIGQRANSTLRVSFWCAVSMQAQPVHSSLCRKPSFHPRLNLTHGMNNHHVSAWCPCRRSRSCGCRATRLTWTRWAHWCGRALRPVSGGRAKRLTPTTCHPPAPSLSLPQQVRPFVIPVAQHNTREPQRDEKHHVTSRK